MVASWRYHLPEYYQNSSGKLSPTGIWIHEAGDRKDSSFIKHTCTHSWYILKLAQDGISKSVINVNSCSKKAVIVLWLLRWWCINVNDITNTLVMQSLGSDQIEYQRKHYQQILYMKSKKTAWWLRNEAHQGQICPHRLRHARSLGSRRCFHGSLDSGRRVHFESFDGSPAWAIEIRMEYSISISSWHNWESYREGNNNRRFQSLKGKVNESIATIQF